MDSGFNMLGQFQGDSSLGLGSFQGNSQSSTDQLFHLQNIGWFKEYDKKSKAEKATQDKLVEMVLDRSRTEEERV